MLVKLQGNSKITIEEERAARMRAEASLHKLVQEVEELKNGHAQKVQQVLHQLQGLHEASASHQNELMQEQSKRRAAEEALKQIVGDVDNLKAGSSMQMQKVGAELERLQQDNMHQMQALQRECNDAKDSLASANTALQAERQARIMAEQGMKDAWTMMTDLKAQLNKQQMDLQHELAQQPTDEVFVRLPQCKFMYSYGILL